VALDLVESQPIETHLLREYIIDMVDQLAAMAAEHDDLATARTLWSCWGRLGRLPRKGSEATALWEGSTTAEVVTLRASPRPPK
jgi:hypothetical protein